MLLLLRCPAVVIRDSRLASCLQKWYDRGMNTLATADIIDGIKGAVFNYAFLSWGNAKATDFASSHAVALADALGDVTGIPARDVPVRVAQALTALSRAEGENLRDVDFAGVAGGIARRLVQCCPVHAR